MERLIDSYILLLKKILCVRKEENTKNLEVMECSYLDRGDIFIEIYVQNHQTIYI